MIFAGLFVVLICPLLVGCVSSGCVGWCFATVFRLWWAIAGVCACYFGYRWILPRLWLLAFCCVFVGVMF